MIIVKFRTHQLERDCTVPKFTVLKYGKRMAGVIHERIDQITAADNVDMLTRMRIGRCHALTNNRKGQYAMDLVHPYRLVFEEIEENGQTVCILEIVNYHD